MSRDSSRDFHRIFFLIFMAILHFLSSSSRSFSLVFIKFIPSKTHQLEDHSVNSTDLSTSFPSFLPSLFQKVSLIVVPIPKPIFQTFSVNFSSDIIPLGIVSKIQDFFLILFQDIYSNFHLACVLRHRQDISIYIIPGRFLP